VSTTATRTTKKDRSTNGRAASNGRPRTTRKTTANGRPPANGNGNGSRASGGNGHQPSSAVKGMELLVLKLDEIVVPKDRHQRRGRRLAGQLETSMKENGQNEPVSVTPNGDGKFRLIAGGGRLENARKLGWTDLLALVKYDVDAKAEAAAVAIENMVRENLSPAEEADAMEVMIHAGHTQDEAARKLGLKGKAKKPRLALVGLPDTVRAAFHEGLPVSHAELVHQLYTGNHAIGEEIGALALKLPAEVASALGRGAGGLFTQMSYLHGRAKLKGAPPFIASVRRGDLWHRALDWTGPKDPDGIQLTGDAGDWFRKRWEDKNGRTRTVFELSEEDLDTAVGVGAAFHEKGEFGCVFIHDLAWLTERINGQVLPRMMSEHQENDAAAAIKEAEMARTVDGLSASELAAKLKRAFMRDLKPEAHSANLDLGAALMNNLASVKLDRDTAMFFAYEALGSPNGTYGYGGSDQVRYMSECLARVMPGWPTVDRKTLKSGKVKETIIYMDPVDAEKRMWEFIKGARTPEEILGRVLTVFAAAGNFCRECGPNGGTPHRQRPSNPEAQKALARIVKPHIPATIKRVDTKRGRFNPAKEADRLIEKANAGTETPEDQAAQAA
jgi:ParB/RepB/Spo0J family partition protein